MTALTICESIRVNLSHLLRRRTPSKFKQIFTKSLKKANLGHTLPTDNALAYKAERMLVAEVVVASFAWADFDGNF